MHKERRTARPHPAVFVFRSEIVHKCAAWTVDVQYSMLPDANIVVLLWRFLDVFHKMQCRTFTTGIRSVIGIKMICDELEYGLVQQLTFSSRSYVQASIILFSLHVACSNYAVFNVSIFLFQGNSCVYMYVCGDQRRWIGDNQYGRRRYLTACVQAHVERPLIFDIHERNPFEIQILGFPMAIRETEFSSDTIPLTGYAG